MICHRVENEKKRIKQIFVRSVMRLRGDLRKTKVTTHKCLSSFKKIKDLYLSLSVLSEMIHVATDLKKKACYVNNVCGNLDLLKKNMEKLRTTNIS